MERQAWILQIRAGMEEEYRLAHENVWPELIQASKEAGFKNHSVFVHGRTVVAYLEAEDIRAAEIKLAQYPVLERWDAAMSKLLEAPNTPAMQEVFHFD